LSEKVLIEEAKRRIETYKNLKHYLRIILDSIRELDNLAEIYLFGSVVEGTYTYSSDIDVLVITNSKPEEVISTLWSKGVETPFEIHVINKNVLNRYEKRSRIIRLEDFLKKLEESDAGVTP